MSIKSLYFIYRSSRNFNQPYISLPFVKNNKLLKAQNLNTDSKHYSRKQNVHQTIFFYSKLSIQFPGDIFVRHKLLFWHLPSDLKSKIYLLFTFFACTILSNGPLRKHGLSVQKVMSAGCNWLILIHFVYFDYDWQITLSECIVTFL